MSKSRDFKSPGNGSSYSDKEPFCDIVPCENPKYSDSKHIYVPNDKPFSIAFLLSDNSVLPTCVRSTSKLKLDEPVVGRSSHDVNDLSQFAPLQKDSSSVHRFHSEFQIDMSHRNLFSHPVVRNASQNVFTSEFVYSASVDNHSNLIDFSPPSSPFKLKNNMTESKFAFQSEPPVWKPESFNSDTLADEFSLLASDFEDGIEIGSLVQVTSSQDPLYGVVRWLGKPSGSQVLVGIELEEEIEEGTEGTFSGHRYFTCPPRKGVFVPHRNCKLDTRFNNLSTAHTTQASNNSKKASEMEHGGPDCPSIVGVIAPISQASDLEKLGGKYQGIQGHHNSCYLDATLFSMFTFTSIFDNLLYRPATRDDIPQYEEVQRILREEIVNPLRLNRYVRADKVMKLRRLLQKLSSVTGLTNEEKDPEEFLHCLLSQTLRAEPFLKLSSGQGCYHHQLFVEKDEKLLVPTVQQLFEQSFLSSDIKLKEVPPVLIIQMPRFGKSYKMYPHVLPSSLLDITDVLENSPRQCIVCGRLAEMECQQCLGQCGTGLESIAFCTSCLHKVHSHKKRTTHKAQPLQVPAEFAALQEHCIIPRLYMELFAVVCIATSHYVAFVKCGTGPDAPWCFFDSMADRKGEQNGYNIPEVVPCPDLPHWLSDEWDKHLLSNPDQHSSSALPDYARRLFSDAYMCLYQSPDLMMYR